MFPSKHLSKQYLFKTWLCPSWDGLWALSIAKINKKNFKCEGE